MMKRKENKISGKLGNEEKKRIRTFGITNRRRKTFYSLIQLSVLV